MKGSIIALGFAILVAGIVLLTYSVPIIGTFCEEKTMQGACLYYQHLGTVYPDRQSGLAISVVGVVCMAIGAVIE